ncbi:DUF3040 domain-containing protein [Streptomyces ziwulingensis]
MSTDRLSDYERRVLDEVERELRRDRRLDRRLSTLRLHRCPGLTRLMVCRPRTPAVLLLLTLSVALLVTGIVTSAPAVIWAFAAMWPVTLFTAFRLLCRWTEG